MKQPNKILTVFHYLRMALTGAVLIPLFAWERLPVLHVVALVAVVITVLLELAYVVYLRTGFDRVVATVEKEYEEKGKDDLVVHYYLLRYEYKGEQQACRYGDTILSNTFAGTTYCPLMIDKNDHRVMLIDDFKRRYLNLIFAALLLASVLSFYGVWGDSI